jgi:CheY-like chemotaxis protein
MILKDKYVFVVEDNLQNRIIFQMMLVRHGAHVEFERWGRNTLERLQAMHKVDVIILDLNLAEGISGYEIFDQIRSMPTFNDIPIVAASATDPATGIPKTQMKGFNGFIAKPLDDAKFPRQIAKIIEGEKIWDSGI